MLRSNPFRPLAFALLVSACASSADSVARGPMSGGIRYGAGVSIGPNLGAEVAIEKSLGRLGAIEWAGEFHLAHQFLDDETFADDGNPSAGAWTQAGLALRGRIRATEQRSWTIRFGPEWFEARGEPNIVSDPGHYFGVRTGLGFETRIGRFAVGPELSGVWVLRAGNFEVVPQLVWGLRWSP